MEKVYSAYQHQSTAFVPERLKQYHLRLLLRDDLAQYAVLSEAGKILAVKEYRSKVALDFTDFFEALCTHDYFLKEEYASTSVVYGALEFSLVPSRYFAPEHLRELAGTAIKSNTELDHLQYCDVQTAGATAIFTIPYAVKGKCDHHLGKPVYVPACQPAINMAYHLVGSAPNMVLVNIFAGQFVLTAMKDGRLHLCNAYTYGGITDIVYFVQLVMDILKLQPEQSTIYIVGEFEKDSELLRQLLKYIPSLRIPEALANRFETQSDKLPHWRYAFLSF